MSQTETKQPENATKSEGLRLRQSNTAPEPEKKPGLFGRIIQKLDSSMKLKAEEKSKQSSCCGGSGDKGNKCC